MASKRMIRKKVWDMEMLVGSLLMIFPDVECQGNKFIDKFECDLLVYDRHNFKIEFELKVSRSDYSMDFLKSRMVGGTRIFKHDAIQYGLRVNQFYFITPPDVVSYYDVPKHAGLIHFGRDNSDMRIVKVAPILTLEIL